MELQLALDFVEMERALDLIARTERSIDIFEAGTPLLLREGAGAVRKMRASRPGIRILADAKIVDGGYGEAKMLFDAGADLVTVLAVASTETLVAVQKAAEESGGTVVADMIASADPAADLPRLSDAGIGVACVHRPADSGSWKAENSRLLEEVAGSARAGGRLRIMVAGGISLETVVSILPLSPQIVVVGGSIVNAKDPAQAADELRRALR